MVVQAAIPIITAVGEFTTPYLLRKAGEIGLTRFIQVYGSAAATAIGIQKTQPVDLQTEKILGMPVSHITGQGEVYDDIDYSAIDEDREVEPLGYIDTVHGGKGPLEPIKAKPFPAETEVKKWDESFKAPEKIETTKGLEIPPQEIKIPPGFETPKTVDTSILTQDKPKDITKQTKELVSDITADVSKEKIDKYFEGIDELYDNEWYGSAKSIRDFIDNTTVDEDDKVYDKQKSIYTSYGMEKPIHEFFEDEWQGGVGNLGNKDAAMVIQMGNLYRLGEFNGPQYYQEYIDKLHEYTLNTLGKEFKVYRLTRKDEMEAFLNPDRPEEATDTKSFSLSKNKALAFQGLWHDLFTTAHGKPREDLVLIEAIIPYDSLVMRGFSAEDEIVINGDFLEGKELNFYDLKNNLIQGATEGPLVKNVTKQTEELGL